VRLPPILIGMVLRSILVLLLFAPSAYAQSLITGTVTDPQSTVIPDARGEELQRGIEVPAARRMSLSYDGSSIATGQIDFGGRAGRDRMFGIA
jgi:hypothetical protein